ncbi:MAG: hypothetical protein FWE63_02000 [Bacteroidales bacterium]|nr:hypothetical protein [Bacteroidales bacterium]
MRKKSRKKRKGLSGTLEGVVGKRKGKNRFGVDSLKDESMPILLVAAGLVAANFGSKVIDGFVKPDSSAIKKSIKPLLLAGTGLALKIMFDKKMVKDFGTGLAVGGILSGIKTFTKQSLIENLNGDLEYFNPDLPEIHGYLESGMDGDLENLADVDGEFEDVDVMDGQLEEIDGGDDEDLDGDLSGRKNRREKFGRRKGRRSLPQPAIEDASFEDAVDFA